MAKFGFYQTEHKNNNNYAFVQKQVWEKPDHALLKWPSPTNQEKWLSENKFSSPLPHEKINTLMFGRICNIVANKFLELGIRENDKVIIKLPLSFQYFICLFSLQKIGAIPVIIEHWYNQELLSGQLKNLNPRAIIGQYEIFSEDSIHYEDINKIGIKIIGGEYPNEKQDYFNGILDKLMKGKDEADTVPIEQSHHALIKYETIDSKNNLGIIKTHHQMAAEHFSYKKLMQWEEKEVNFCFFPNNIMHNILAGVTTVIPQFDFNHISERELNLFHKQITEEKVTSLTAPPFILKKIIPYFKNKKLQIKNIKKVTTGGGALSRDDVINLKNIFPEVKIYIIYGQSQAEPISATTGQQFVSPIANPSKDPELFSDGVCLGKFIKGVNYKIIKPKSEKIEIKDLMDWMEYEVKKNTPGELLVAAEHITTSFFNNKEISEKLKIVDDFGITWHRTGDLVRIDEEKRIWLLGKTEHSIKTKDGYLFPGWPELMAKSVENVKNAAFIVKGDKNYCYYSTNGNKQCIETEKTVEKIFNKNKITIEKILFIERIPMHPLIPNLVYYQELEKLPS